MSELELEYKELIKPENFVSCFENDEEFVEWARLGTSEDLKAALKAFEDAELFIHCKLLKEVLDTKEI
jgi:hypothetical protein